MQQRSAFITVVAWIFIVLSGLGMLELGILLFVPLQSLMPPAQMHVGEVPQNPELFVAYLRGMFLMGFVLGTWVLVSSIGLLLRKNWARISYIIMMILGIGWSSMYLLMGIFVIVMVQTVGLQSNPTLPPGARAVASAFMAILMIFGAVFVALYGWILVKLLSESVRKEFQPPGLQA